MAQRELRQPLEPELDMGAWRLSEDAGLRAHVAAHDFSRWSKPTDAALPAAPRPPFTNLARNEFVMPLSDPSAFAEWCIFRSGMAVVGGAVLGFVFGAAFSGYGGGLTPMEGFTPADRGVPAMQALKEGFVNMKTRGLQSGKNFALVGGVYSAIECSLDKFRGRHDLTGSIASGFGAGALIAVRAGPHAMLMGGATFAAFSAVMELVLHRMG